MSVTLDTSQFEISVLKEFAPENNLRMSVTLDTFHDAIGPWDPFAHLPNCGVPMHESTAVLSSDQDCGANPVSRSTNLGLQAWMPSAHVCSVLPVYRSLGLPHFLNQEPPRAQQVGVPSLVTPHLMHFVVAIIMDPAVHT